MTAKPKLLASIPPNYPLIIISGIVFGTFLIFFLPPYLSWVTPLGHRLAFYGVTHDYTVANDYATALIFSIILGMSILFWPVDKDDKLHLLWGWIVKCFITLFVLLFLEEHYSSDAFGFWAGPLSYEFKDLVEYQGLIFGVDSTKRGTDNVMLFIFNYNKIAPRSLTLSFHSAKLLFSMIGFVAIYIFYQTSVLLTKKKNHYFLWILILFPSLLIWTSRIGKEPLILLTISLYTYGLINWHIKRSTFYFFLIVIAFILTMHLRLWMGPVIALPLVFYFLYSKKGFVRLFFLGATVIIMGLSSNHLAEKMKVTSTAHLIEELDFHASNKAKGGSAIKSDVNLRGVLDIATFTPYGMFTVLFRPLPLDLSGPVGFLSGLEGLLLLFLSIRAIIRTKLKEIKDPILVFAIVFILSWAFLYAFAGQNFGTIVRWKTQILPTLIGLTLYLGQHRSEIIKPFGSKSSNPILSGN